MLPVVLISSTAPRPLPMAFGEDVMLIRHLARVIFEFFPDMPLLDLCVFNASGWDRHKELVKVSLHLVAP